MKLSLIICTYQRLDAIMRLVDSIRNQTVYPDQILVIDGSIDDETLVRFRESEVKNLQYYKVKDPDRGLTRQRNYGIDRVAHDMDIVAFLDDDIILQPDYFARLLETYTLFPEAVGVGGYITNEVKWEPSLIDKPDDLNHFYYDGYRRKESSRYKLRRRLGLAPDTPPGVYPAFGHGRSVSFLPPSGKVYKVNQLMGGVSSFPKSILDTQKFSTYFQGYGLYEDAHFTLRLSKMGALYINTAAQLEHHHDPDGRPNLFHYGKMVVLNGWFVWRTFNPKPSIHDQMKWFSITILLLKIRWVNVITTKDRWGSFQESIGRSVGLFSLIFNAPRD